MAVVFMKRTQLSDPTLAGALYQEEVQITGAVESNIYVFPFTRIYAIALEIAGSGTIQFSNSTIEKLEAGEGKFVAWDGTSEINLALIAFKIVGVSGLVEAVVSVKTTTV